MNTEEFKVRVGEIVSAVSGRALEYAQDLAGLLHENFPDDAAVRRMARLALIDDLVSMALEADLRKSAERLRIARLRATKSTVS